MNLIQIVKQIKLSHDLGLFHADEILSNFKGVSVNRCWASRGDHVLRNNEKLEIHLQRLSQLFHLILHNGFFQIFIFVLKSILRQRIRSQLVAQSNPIR